MDILAHRANLRGPKSVEENSLAACEAALHAGFGLEIDLRRAHEGFLISHDPATWSAANDFAPYAAMFSRYADLPLAVNVKELGYEDELIRLFQEGCFGTSAFYFDFELLEPGQPGAAQRKLRSLPGGAVVRLAARLSDRNEPVERCLTIPAEVVWADEFDSLWLTSDVIRQVHEAGRQVYAISPELHGFNRADRIRRWAEFKAWGIKGVCTDFPLEARDFFHS